jgi:succinate dehydrogenase/fumarate reductase flavoprotein subunit
MVSAALRRQESRGTHLRTDYPHVDDEQWRFRLSDVCPGAD